MAARAQPLKMGNHQIQGLADGVDASDAVNKGQLDTAIGGITATVSSVAVSGGTTGLTTSGSPITTSGTITLAGTLNVANGGTGAASLTANNVILGNGTSAVQFVAPGASGNILTSNGTTWTSAAPAAAWSIAKKTSDQNLTTSSTAFQNVSSLSFSVSANKTYAFRAYIVCFVPATGSNGGGIKLAVNGPSSPTRVVAGTELTSSANAYDSNAVSINAQAVAQYYSFWLQGHIVNGSNAGTLQIRAAQFTSASGTTVVHSGSYLEYVEIA